MIFNILKKYCANILKYLLEYYSFSINNKLENKIKIKTWAIVFIRYLNIDLL